MIELKNVRAGYPGKPVLHDLNLTIPAGQVTVIVGPNGCGKSTLLKALICLNPHHSGEILVDGKSIGEYAPNALARKIAYLPQKRSVPDITVRRMVLHGRFPYLSYPRHYRPQDHEAVDAALTRLGLTDLAETPMNKLSGGMQQKVYIAMALAQDTPVIAMDEPTAFLDISHQLQLMVLARELASSGKAVLLVLHDLPLALGYAHRIAVMKEGRILDAGTPEEIYTRGSLEQAFNVKIRRTAAEEGWQYYCIREDSYGILSDLL